MNVFHHTVVMILFTEIPQWIKVDEYFRFTFTKQWVHHRLFRHDHLFLCGKQIEFFSAGETNEKLFTVK